MELLQNTSLELRSDLFKQFVEYVDRSERTTTTYMTNLKMFAAWMRYQEISQPTRSDIINYRNWLQADHEAIKLDPGTAAGWSYQTDGNGNRITRKCASSTVRGYLRAVTAFFKWLSANGLYADVASNIHSPAVKTVHKREAFKPAEVLKIEKSISSHAEEKIAAAGEAKKDRSGRVERATEQSKRLTAMYLLAVNAGLRTIELERACVKDISTIGGITYLSVWGKGHSEADTKKPLAPEVAEAINDYLNSRSDAYTKDSPLFVSTGNRSKGKRIAARTISGMLKEAMRAAGYDDAHYTAHSLRHTAGTVAMMKTNNNVYYTQQYMRHQSPVTTELYLHVDTMKQEAELANMIYKEYHTTD